MRRAAGIAIPVVAALAVMGWLALRPAPVADPAPADAAAAKAAAAPGATRPGLAASRPADAPAVHARGTPAPVPAPSLFNEYLQARQYREMYDRLRNSAAGDTAEGRLVMWEILRNCATITEGRRYVYRPNVPRREDFLAGLAPGDPLREKRIAAYDEFTANRCAGFEGVAITQAELDRVLASAAAAGDPRARALSLEQELWMQRRSQGRDAVALSDSHLDTLRQLAGTRDPEAIRVAGRVMSNIWADTALRIGPDQQPVEQRPFMNAWLVLACEFGQPCGPDTPRMQQACALQGHCAAQSYPDYLYYYASTPHDSQMLAQDRALLRNAIESGDWSQLAVIRGLPTPSARINFVPGPR